MALSRTHSPRDALATFELDHWIVVPTGMILSLVVLRAAPGPIVVISLVVVALMICASVVPRFVPRRASPQTRHTRAEYLAETGGDRWGRFENRLATSHSNLRELERVFDDALQRDLAWNDLRSTIREDLWKSASHLEGERDRRHLVDVLDAAVTRLDALALESRHLALLARTLEALQSDRIDGSVIHRFEDEWEEMGVETLPDLGSIFKSWTDEAADTGDDTVRGKT